MNPEQILSDEHKQQVLEAHTKLNEIKQLIKYCEQAGLDMSEQASQVERLESLTRGIINTFITPRRKRL
jgi:hypothetical protein